jgi:lysozyme family protein|tara:strand:- start:14211 stop:14720 length:510 start_codon:yes stop_codon:yes gene_type:complete
MTIDKVLNDVLDREGWPKYTDHPHDRGGPTKGGITIRTLDAWRHRRCTRKELQRLQKKEALSILRRRYVDVQGIQLLDNYLIQPQVVDNAVLSGPVLAVKDLQRAINVSDDGIIGPVTIKKIDEFGQERTNTLLVKERTIRLSRIVVNDDTQLVFLVGWLKRSLSFLNA